MAKKIQLSFPFDAFIENDVPRDNLEIQGYECGYLAVFQSPLTRLWRVCHKYNYSPVQGSEFKGWKQKKQALAFAEEIQKHGLQFDVKDASEFQTRNDHTLMAAAFNAAHEKAKET